MMDRSINPCIPPEFTADMIGDIVKMWSKE